MKIKFDPRAVDALKKLDKQVQHRIIKFIRQRLETKKNPKHIGSSLRGNMSGLWKYRVGDYRLVCQIDGDIEILVLHIGHRKNVYKKSLA
jgi:mRNA interferase RelE/StbE